MKGLAQILGVLTLIGLLGVGPVFGLFGNPVLASLTSNTFGGNVFDSLTGAFGDCVAITAQGNIGDVVVNLVASPASTNNTATVRIGIYPGASIDSPGSSCTPSSKPLAVSGPLSLTTLTTTLSQYVFTFASSQQANVGVGQVVFVAVLVDDVGAGQISVGAQTAAHASAPANQNRETCATAQATEIFDSNFNIQNPGTNCGLIYACNSNDCNTYVVDGITPQSTGNGSPSPYGNNPVSYPCCNPVTAQALSGASLRAPDVDSLPLIWLFILLLIVTLGSYVVVRSRQKRPPAKQYELGI